MNKLRYYMKKCKLTVVGLGMFSRISPPDIRRYLNDQGNIDAASASDLYRLSTLCGCSMEDMLDDTVKKGIQEEIYRSLINQLVEMEMDEYCHNDRKIDYPSAYDLYISRASKESYEDYIESYYPQILKLKPFKEIQRTVLAEIKRRELG